MQLLLKLRHKTVSIINTIGKIESKGNFQLNSICKKMLKDEAELESTKQVHLKIAMYGSKKLTELKSFLRETVYSSSKYIFQIMSDFQS